MAAEPEIVNHVPDEVCVLVRTSRTDNIGEMYQQVRDSLNGALRSVVEQPSSRAWADNDDLRRELIPEALQTRFNARSEILQPLERRGISLNASSGERHPWHSVPGSDDITYHLYYALGADRVDFGEETRDERSLRLDSVRQLVNLLNHPPTGVSRVNGSGWRVDGSAPNWLTVAAQFACGGPAGAPRAETQSGRWRFRFGEDLEQAFKSTPRGESAKVVVAILDTAPRSANFQTHGN